MRTFDLRTIQQTLHSQLGTAMEILDAIDILKSVQQSMPPDGQQTIQAAIDKLARASQQIGSTAGKTSRELHRFMSQ